MKPGEKKSNFAFQCEHEIQQVMKHHRRHCRCRRHRCRRRHCCCRRRRRRRHHRTLASHKREK